MHAVIRFWNLYRRNMILIQPCPHHFQCLRLKDMDGVFASESYTDCDFEDSYLLLLFNDRPGDQVLSQIKKYLAEQSSD